MYTLKTINPQLQQLKSILLSRTAKDSLTVVSGDLMVAVIGFLISLIVIKVLGPADYGSLAISVAVMATTVQIFDLGLRTTAVRYTALFLKTDQSKARAILAVVFKSRLILGVMVFLGGLFIAEPLAVMLFNKPHLTPYLKLAFIGSFGSLMYDFILTHLQAHQQFTKLAGLRLMTTIAKATLVVLLILFQSVTVSKIITAYILVPFFGFAVGTFLISWRFIEEKDNNKENIKLLLRFSKWLMISYALSAFNSRAEIFLLAHFKESATVGIYSAAHTLVLPITLVCASLTKTLLPKVTSIITISKLQEYFRMSVRLLLLIAIMFLPYYFLGPAIIGIIGSKYSNSIPVFSVLFFNALILGLIGPIVLILFTLNKPYVSTFIACGQFCFSFTANYFVIPIYGALGAAVVASCSSILVALVTIYLVIGFLKTDDLVIKEGSSPV